MASAMTNATVVSTFADYYNKLKLFAASPHAHDANLQQLINGLANDIQLSLTAIVTDGGYTVNFTEPRYTIVPFTSTFRPYKVVEAGSLSYTMKTSNGELNSAPVWSGIDLPSWVSINPTTGVLSGTAPSVNTRKFNTITGGTISNLSDIYPMSMISCKNAFGESVNGPLEMYFEVVDQATPGVTSAATMTGVHAGALTSYTITASNTPTSFVAYDLAQLNAGTGGTVALNPSTGVISGNCGSLTTAGTYTIYVAATNAKGEGVDLAVVVTLT